MTNEDITPPRAKKMRSKDVKVEEPHREDVACTEAWRVPVSKDKTYLPKFKTILRVETIRYQQKALPKDATSAPLKDSHSVEVDATLFVRPFEVNINIQDTFELLETDVGESL